MHRGRMQALVTVAVLGLLLAGCTRRDAGLDSGAVQSTTTTTTPAKPGGELAFGIEGDPNGLDPTRNAWDPSGIQVALALFDPMFTFAADGKVAPYLVDTYSHSSDYLVWTVKLHAGVTFHDGSPLTADDIIALERAERESPIIGKAAANMDHTERIDDLTVGFHLLYAQASWPSALAGQGGYIASQKQITDPEGQSKAIGTGPFMLQSWDIGKEMRLVRNPHYWRKDANGVHLPYLDAVTFKVITDVNTQIAALQKGDVDAIRTRSLTGNLQVEALRNTGIEITHDTGSSEASLISFNTAKAPFDDLRVRQAVVHATDLKRLAGENGWPLDQLIDRPFGRNSPWFNPDAHQLGYDPAKARDLLADYRRDTGHDVSFELTGFSDTKIVQHLAEEWEAAGMHVTQRSVDVHKGTVLAVIGQYDAIMLDYFAAPDPDMLWHFWHSFAIADINKISINLARFGDPQIDHALDIGRASGDPAVRKEAYGVVQKRFTETVPYLWLYGLDWVISSRPKVHQLRNMTLPDGRPAMPFAAGQFRLTETWVDA